MAVDHRVQDAEFESGILYPVVLIREPTSVEDQLPNQNQTMITVNDKQHPWHPGMTVSSLVESAARKDPHFDPNAVVIILNNRTIPRSEFDRTEIKDKDRIFFIVFLAGG